MARVLILTWHYLAIAARQYTVPFPLAIVAHELSSGDRVRLTATWRWLAPLASAATIGGWTWWFGGAAPLGELAAQAIDPNRFRHLNPAHFV
jgi:hypothetical protein